MLLVLMEIKLNGPHCTVNTLTHALSGKFGPLLRVLSSERNVHL